jgi:hypothetical protein
VTGGRIFAVGSFGPAIGASDAELAGISRVGAVLLADVNIPARATAAAAIGSGYALHTGTSELATLTLQRAIVDAESQLGAGIGSGFADNGTAIVGTLCIQNSVVYASCRESGAGIGSGFAAGDSLRTTRDAAQSVLHGLRIEASNCTVVGGSSAAGIGTGEGHIGRSHVGSITFVGGFCHVIGGTFAAGIGTGYARYGNTSILQITMADGDFLVAQSGAAGIGTGYSYHGQTEIGVITLQNGTFVVFGASNGPGIGAGSAAHGVGLLSSVVLENGAITAVGGVFAPAIGSGGSEHGTAILANLTIVRPSLSLTGSVGIGSVDSEDLRLLDLGPSSAVLGIDCWPSTEACIAVSRIVHRHSRVTASTDSSRFFETGGVQIDGLEFFAEYRVVAEAEPFGEWPILRFPLITTDLREAVTFTFTHASTGYNRTVVFQAGLMKGMALTLQEAGEYGVDAVGPSGVLQLVMPNGSIVIRVHGGSNVVESAHLERVALTEETVRVGTWLAIAAGSVVFGAVILIGAKVAFRRIRAAKATAGTDPKEG